jgi:hypothetical protein
MKKILLITFDFTRYDEPTTSLAMGSLLSRLKADPCFISEFVAEHVSFNLYAHPNLTPDNALEVLVQAHDLTKIHAIAIGCYIWADHLVNPLISTLRTNGFVGRIILGGYQIAYREGITAAYPGGNIFLLGSAGESLLRSLYADMGSGPLILDYAPDLERIPSPYLTGEIQVKKGQGRVRLETKRGCMYNCTYCADKDLLRHQIYSHSLTRVRDELAFLNAMSVKKVNVVDPIFNSGDKYMKVLEACTTIGMQSKITLQVSFEHVKGSEGEAFLEICSSLDITLEFGLQTIIEEEMKSIQRQNNLPHVKSVMNALRRRGIPHEVSLIYGLPGQTLDSFQKSVRFLLGEGCSVVKCYPLKVFNGTELWRTKDRWGMKETSEGRFSIPLVTTSDSFDRDEWEMMRSLAKAVRRKTQHDWSAGRSHYRKIHQ